VWACASPIPTPALALERIEALKDGRITYAMKTPRRGSTHRAMSPVEFLARLAILVPPPYFPLVRYHGVFAARSSWRALVTPKPPDGVARRKKPKACTFATAAKADAPDAVPARTTPPASANESANASANALPSALAPAPAALTAAPIPAPAVPIVIDDPTTISVEPWGRILDGELYAASSRVEWAVLLRRTFGFDALRCPRCAARMRVVAILLEPSVVKKILSHIGVPTEPLPRARARDPTGQQRFDFHAA